MPKRLEVAILSRVFRRGCAEWVVIEGVSHVLSSLTASQAKEVQRQDHAWLDHGTARRPLWLERGDHR